MMKDYYSDISDLEIECLEYVLHNPKCNGGDMLFTIPTCDGVINILLENKLIKNTSTDSVSLEITELGRSVLRASYDKNKYDKSIKDKETRHFWIGIIVNGILSIIAIIISIVALFKP